MRLKLKRIVSIILVVITLFALSANCFAATPYSNYIYKGEEAKAVEAPAAATPVDVLSTFGAANGLSNPQDLFVDSDNHLYIADTGNNRILKLDKDYNLIREYKTFINNGVEDSFKAPNGIYVDANEVLYVADTENLRVVKLNDDGTFNAILPTPTSQLLAADFVYKPIKLSSDRAGRIFVCSAGFNQGLLELDKNGDFVQMLGAPKVVSSFFESIRKMFQTKEQKARTTNLVPREYNNISIDKEDFVFVTTASNDKSEAKSTGITPLYKLNAKGADVLRKITGTIISADLNWGSMNYKGPSYIVDVLNLDNGINLILDQKRSRAFAYNNDGVMLFEFGGVGNSFGTVTSATALEYYNNKYLMLDSTKNQITAYENTDYANTLFAAEEYKKNDEYEKESAAWNKILALNESNPLVLRQLGKISYRQRDMKESMDYLKLANDKDEYSKSFEFYRRELIKKYFTPFMIIVLTLVILWFIYKIAMKRYRRDHPKTLKPAGPLRYAFYVLGRPLDGFWDLKNEKRGNMKTAILLFFLAIVAAIVKTQFTGFIFQTQLPSEINVMSDILTIALPCILWIIATRCVTSLMDGEGNLNNIIISTAYSLTPIIIVYPIATILSNILSKSEGVIVTVLIGFALVWTLMLIFCALVQTHNYTLGKAVGVLFISLVVIVIIMFVALLFFSLIQQMLGFGFDLRDEIINR